MNATRRLGFLCVACFKTMTMNIVLIIVVFLCVASSKTTTMSTMFIIVVFFFVQLARLG
jgi:hypothetical protein